VTNFQPDPHLQFPAGFFSRSDESSDARFYEFDRFVTHIDDRAIAAVGALYGSLGLTGSVLDIMSSWVSHFTSPPSELVVLGMNAAELQGNPMATDHVVHDLNVDPNLPFPDNRFDALTCCVSIDYLVRPIDVLADAARITKPGGTVVCTFSNRCFPTKAVRGWLSVDEPGRVALVEQFFRLTNSYVVIDSKLCTPPSMYGDPLYAVWGSVS
jgi:SAM-dependent methyltransferase